MYRFRDNYVYVMYYVYVTSGPSLLIESTDSMIEDGICLFSACLFNYLFLQCTRGIPYPSTTSTLGNSLCVVWDGRQKNVVEMLLS